MPSSMIDSKSTLFLLGLLYLQASSADATISTSAGFPQDVFAKPAFQVSLGHTGKGAPTLPIKRSDAISILEQQESSSSSSSAFTSNPSALAVPNHTDRHSDHPDPESSRTLFWSLQRSSPTEFQLCSIPDFTHTPADKHSSNQRTNASRSRQELVRSAQALLEPLKKVCLYHTFDWFTYSFCHGREIRQFRRLGPKTAALKAFKAAGGGEAGEKAGLEAEKKVNSVSYPVADPEFPAFVLGRWTPENEAIVGDDRSYHRRQPLSDAAQTTTGVSLSSSQAQSSASDAAGMDLVEEVQFGDWDEEELFAAEAKALAQLEGSGNAVEANHDVVGSSNGSQRHRYVSQKWGNGTMCDMNHQPRTVEVQFHCSNRKPAEDRIVMFKETTICNYVLIVETPRLCADPAFGSEKEEDPLPIQCHQVVEDNYAGPTVGDPDKVVPGPLSQLQDKESVTPKADSTKGSVAEDATSSAQGDAADASTTSHTYGDLSRYGSVYDDYFDEALGGHGALYEQHYAHHHHDHDHHDHDHDHDGHFHLSDDDLVQDAEVLVEIGIDQDGKLLVNKINPDNSAAKDSRRRESGKRRSDDDTDPEEDSVDSPLEVQLDMDDFLSVLKGEEGGSLEKKLAEKLSAMLNKQLKKEETSKEEKETTHTPDEVARLYDKVMSAVTASGKGDERKEVKEEGKGARPRQGKGQAKQNPAMRMEKVGDSLSERVRRFYDAKERDGKDEKKQSGAPPIAEHLEL